MNVRFKTPVLRPQNSLQAIAPALSLVFLFLLVATFNFAQPSVEWDHTIGGDNFEEMSSLLQTSDDGFIFGGTTSSDMNGDVSQMTRGLSDFWMGKLDQNGNLLWDVRFGGDMEENMQSLHQTADGGYILGGWTRSGANGDKTEPNQGNTWDFDYWIVKTDAGGNKLWDKTFGGPHHDQLWVVKQSNDGGYLLGGMSFSDLGEDKSEASRGDWDFWIIKTDANGNKQWDRTYGGSAADMLLDFQITADGGYLLTGLSGSPANGDKMTPNYGSLDYWLVKIDANGIIQWDQTFGGTGNDQCRTLMATSDGGFLLGGFSDSPISGNKTDVNYGSLDYWVIKTDNNGVKIWDRSIGGSEAEDLKSLGESSKGIYLIGGNSASNISGTRTQASRGGRDYYLSFLDSDGNILQDAAYGGNADDQMTVIIPTSDDTYAIGGMSNSDISGEKTENNLGPPWSLDSWILKLQCNFSAELGTDTIICSGSSVVLDLSQMDHCDFNWSDGSEDALRIVQPTSNTTYVVTVTDIHGCTSVDDLFIEVNSLPTVDLGNDTTACQGTHVLLDAENPGGSYLWSIGATTQSISINTNGTYEVTVTDANMCTTSDAITVNFMAPPLVSLEFGATICEGDQVTLDAGNLGSSYIWSTGATTQTINVSHAGTYGVTVSNGIGCLASDDFVLTVNTAPEALLMQDTAICPGESVDLVVLLNGTGPFDVTYTDGTSSHTLNSILSGYSIGVNPSSNTTYSITNVTDSATPACSNTGNSVDIRLLPIPETVVDTFVCEGAAIFLQGAFQNTSDTYRDTLSSFLGCDSIIITNLLVTPLPITQIDLSSCHPADTGTVIKILSGQYCDSTIITTTVLLPSDSTFNTFQSCNPADTGIVTLHLNNQFGCDSTVINLTQLLPSDSTFNTFQSCNPVDTGLVVLNLNNQFGCDSMVINVTQLLPSDSTFNTFQSCNPADTGIVVLNLNNQFGCDSTVINLTQLLISDSTFNTLQSCNPADTGIVVLNLNNQFGCDSTVINLTQLLLSDTSWIFDNTCNPIDTGIFVSNLTNIDGCDSIIIHDVNLINADTIWTFDNSCNPIDTGIFISNLTNIDGCDSIIIHDVNLVNADTSWTFENTCNPIDTGIFISNLTNIDGCDSIIIHDVNLVNADTSWTFDNTCNPIDTGIFISNLTNIDGCDSIIIHDVNLVNADTTWTFDNTCNPIDTGIFISNLTNIDGCDSIIIHDVNLVNADTTWTFENTCNPIDTGIFISNLTNINGCDSIIIHNINLVNADTTWTFENTCNPIDTGIFISNLTNIDGCDSIIIHNVNLVNADTTWTFENTCNPIDTGIFISNLTNINGCDSIIIHDVSLVNPDTTWIFDNSCSPIDTGIFITNLTNIDGCDSLVFTQINYLTSDTTFLLSYSCNPLDTGKTLTQLNNQSGCDSIIIEQVQLTTCDTLQLISGTCEPSEVGSDTTIYMTNIGLDSVVINTTQLWPSDTLYLELGSCNPQDTGFFVQSFANQYGCDSTLFTQVSYWGSDTVFLEQSTCDPSLAGVFYTYLTNRKDCDSIIVETIHLLASDTLLFTSYSCNPNEVGQVQTTLQNDLGCDSIVIEVVELLPPTIQTIYERTCDPEAVGSDTTYLTNFRGCDSLLIQTTILEPIDLLTQVENISCQGEAGGVILIDSAVGGNGPYLYALNEGVFSENLFFSGLAVGPQIIQVQDVNGCLGRDTVIIEDAQRLVVDLGEDLEVNLGEAITLDAFVNQPIDSFYWSSFNELSCDSCLYQDIRPFFSNSYTITVIDENGCQATDRVFVRVVKNRKVYIPNAFSPNADGVNDYFLPFTGTGVAQVNTFRIFNRWGALLFAQEDFNTDNEEMGWDGTYQGQTLNPGVFIYYVEVTFIDGETAVYQGDFTLMK
ncbi:MAG: gliding motility-associated C-terminal domain-containing protein [Bacteroidota bacterium]